jgi:hypothetical protein
VIELFPQGATAFRVLLLGPTGGRATGAEQAKRMLASAIDASVAFHFLRTRSLVAFVPFPFMSFHRFRYRYPVRENARR